MTTKHTFLTALGSVALTACLPVHAQPGRYDGFAPRLGTYRPNDKPTWYNWDNSNRAEAQDAYYRLFVPLDEATSAAAFRFETLPDYVTGDGGVISEAYKVNTVRWINAARYLAADMVSTFADHDPEFDEVSQAAAFLFARNGKKDHYPTPDWEGYNEKADAGAKGLLGAPGARGINGLIRDNGVDNYFVGHRTSVLGRAQAFSIGAVDLPQSGIQIDGHTLYGGSGVVRQHKIADVYPRTGDPIDFPQVYPYTGYVPNAWTAYQVGGTLRVSLQFSHAAQTDFTTASIEVWRDGEPITVTRLYDDPGVLVFDLPPTPNPWDQFSERPPLPDTHFRVRVAGFSFSPDADSGGGTIWDGYPEYRDYVPPPGIYGVPRSYEWDFTIYDETTVKAASYSSTSPVANLSTRALVGSGFDVLIGGFVIEGTEPLRVIVRAMGPYLKKFGIEGAAQNPSVSLYRAIDGTSELVGRVADWKDEASWRMVQSFGLAPEDDGEVAVVATLPPGAYTAVVEDAGKGGVGIVEVYAADQYSTARLANVSTRSVVGNGVDLMIGGVVLQQTRTLVVRARGPELQKYGVQGVLANPRLRVFHNGEEVYANDDWNVPANVRLKGDLSVYKPADDKEPAGVLTLPAGAYTVLVTGSDNGTGIALVEIYDVSDI